MGQHACLKTAKQYRESQFRPVTRSMVRCLQRSVKSVLAEIWTMKRATNRKRRLAPAGIRAEHHFDYRKARPNRFAPLPEGVKQEF